MYELKNNLERYWRVNLLDRSPVLRKKRICRAAVSQKLRNTGLKKQSVSKRTMEYRGFARIHAEFILPLSNHNTTGWNTWECSNPLYRLIHLVHCTEQKQALYRPRDFQEVEIPRFPDDPPKAVRTDRLYCPGNIPGNHFCWGMRYKPEGRRFGSRCCHWSFSLT